MRSDIAPGGTFPDYELPDHTDVPRKLSELQGEDPVILTLARGHYCPKEHQQHLALAAFYSKVAVAYTQIVTIATDAHHELQEFRASVGAQWTFLSDPGRIVQKDLDIQEYTDPDHDPMIPHTIVLKPGLVVHSIYNGYWFWGRLDRRPLARPAGRHREVRPDWDLSAPGLREAWNAGDLSHFHGWSKRTPLGPSAGAGRTRERTSWSSTNPTERLQPSRAAVDAGVPPGRHGGTATRRRWHDTGSTPRRAADRRDLHRPRAAVGTWYPAPAPTGRSSCRTEPRSATSATRCRPTTATCSWSDRAGCATVLPTSSPVSGGARTSTPASTRSAPPPRSRPQPRASTG